MTAESKDGSARAIVCRSRRIVLGEDRRGHVELRTDTYCSTHDVIYLVFLQLTHRISSRRSAALPSTAHVRPFHHLCGVGHPPGTVRRNAMWAVSRRSSSTAPAHVRARTPPRYMFTSTLQCCRQGGMGTHAPAYTGSRRRVASHPRGMVVRHAKPRRSGAFEQRCPATGSRTLQCVFAVALHMSSCLTVLADCSC